MREPWFRIVEIIEPSGRSMADICVDVAGEFGIRVADIRGGRRNPGLRKARRKAFDMVRMERPDLSSAQVAAFFNVEGSTVRHVWRRLEAEAA